MRKTVILQQRCNHCCCIICRHLLINLLHVGTSWSSGPTTYAQQQCHERCAMAAALAVADSGRSLSGMACWLCLHLYKRASEAAEKNPRAALVSRKTTTLPAASRGMTKMQLVLTLALRSCLRHGPKQCIMTCISLCTWLGALTLHRFEGKPRA